MQHGLRADGRNSCAGFRRANPRVLEETKFANLKDLWRTNDDRRGCASRFDIARNAPLPAGADRTDRCERVRYGAITPSCPDQRKEIALALSACPPSVANKAAVYVLGKSGYVKIRDSQNGFTAIVQHSLPTSREPRCMDAEGTRTHLPRLLKVAEWRAQGKSRDEIDRLVADAFAKGVRGQSYIIDSHAVFSF